MTVLVQIEVGLSSRPLTPLINDEDGIDPSAFFDRKTDGIST